MKLGCRRMIWSGMRVATVCLLGVVWASGQTAPAAKATSTAAKTQAAAARTVPAGHVEQTAEQVFKRVACCRFCR